MVSQYDRFDVVTIVISFNNTSKEQEQFTGAFAERKVAKAAGVLGIIDLLQRKP